MREFSFESFMAGGVVGIAIGIVLGAHWAFSSGPVATRHGDPVLAGNLAGPDVKRTELPRAGRRDPCPVRPSGELRAIRPGEEEPGGPEGRVPGVSLRAGTGVLIGGQLGWIWHPGLRGSGVWTRDSPDCGPRGQEKRPGQGQVGRRIRKHWNGPLLGPAARCGGLPSQVAETLPDHATSRESPGPWGEGPGPRLPDDQPPTEMDGQVCDGDGRQAVQRMAFCQTVSF